MKASELRIGNWVSWYDDKGDQFQMDSVTETNGRLVNPIPLTEEWLLKFEYQYANENGQKFYWHIEMPYFQLRRDDVSWGLWYEEDGIQALISKMDIEFVHQLQNTFYFLTGEELTTKQ